MADIKTAFRTKSISLDNVVAIFQGNLDPRTNDQGTLTQVPQGSLYIRSNGELYQKTGTANLDFSLITATGSAVTILDTDLSNTLTLLEGSNLTADRTLTFTTGDASRVLTINGNVTLNDWFDQNVKTTGMPTFAQMFSTGNVGIGTTSPAVRLHIEDNTTSPFTGQPNTSAIKIRNTNFIEATIGTGFIEHDGGGNMSFGVTRPTGVIKIYTGNTEHIRIDSSGNVGIGTTSPQTKLHVLDTGTPISPLSGTHAVFQSSSSASFASRIALFAGTSGIASLDLGDSSQQNSASVLYDNAVNAMALWTVGTERMRIDSTGNVGIGTTSPTVALDVVGDIKASGTITGTLSFTRFHVQTSGASATPTGDIVAKFEKSATSESATITILSSTAGLSSLNMGDTVSEVVGNIAYSNASDYMAFTTNGSEAMRIDSSGNVGIGTTAPGAILHVKTVASTLNTSVDIENTNINNLIGTSKLNLKTSTINWSVGSIQISPSPNINTHFQIKDETNGFVRMIIKSTVAGSSGGQVGIGTINPIAKLDVVSNFVTPLNLSQTASSFTLVTFSGTTGTTVGSTIITGKTSHGGTKEFLKIHINGTEYYLMASTTPA